MLAINLNGSLTMILALNEWVFHDLLGENGADACNETVMFLGTLHQSADQLIVPAEARWREKAFRLTQMTDLRGRAVSKLFQNLLWDTARAIWMHPEDTLPFEGSIPDHTPPEDVYLVVAFLAGSADLLVTTDEGLFNALAQDDSINCRMRNDFLAEYLSAG